MSNGIPIKSVPQSVDDEVALELQQFVVPLFIPRSQHSEPPIRLVGSGTLVQIEGTYHVLTAAHVWNVWKETRDAEQVGLVISSSPLEFKVPRDAITVKEVWDRENSEWGPDLALLQLPPSDVSTIKAHKSFLNLTLQKAALGARPARTEKGLWTITGMVEQFSEVHRYPESSIVEATAPVRACFSMIQQTHEREGYDYLDLGAMLHLPGAPSRFGGMSGGGLWEVGVSMAKSGKISWDGKRYFRGVAFWQSEVSDGRRIVRCHGPQSIFTRAWELWQLPCGG